MVAHYSTASSHGVAVQALIFCRTNFDCDNLEKFFNALAGGQAFRGRKDTGPEAQYSCCVLGGARSMDQRRESLQVGCCALPAMSFGGHNHQSSARSFAVLYVLDLV